MSITLKILVRVGLMISAAVIIFPICMSPQRSDQPSGAARVSSALPYDVDPADLASALKADEVFAANQPPSEELFVPNSQRLFDQFAWRAFIALNWPADANGNPDPHKNIADSGSRAWEHWMESSRIFKSDGSTPDKWGTLPSNADEVALWRVKAAWRQRTTLADQNLQAFS